ncbi:MAG: bifunctional riboflavin kinase/FAD synthetase [Deltaproteobacteria bacterium]|nr:bifunctional riboflavin kinase/FAD synthetase [Deltaproteobacteria bacterium]MBW2661967.1 bifunctional riboflavin kinase/FAD synthetase [Deltaproteobacteria bacterium]
MDIIEDLEKIDRPYKNAVITIGNFDGVHIGHQALFHQVIEKTRVLQGTSVVMTFEPHPIRVLKQNNHPPLITLYEQKTELIAKAGIDILICIPFTLEFASIPAKEFVEEILVKRVGIKAVIVGEDYTFGKNREGTLDLLKTYGKQIGFEVIVVKKIQPSKNSADKISSTRIRELVSEGKVAEAQKLLGRYYQIRGTVMAGRDRGGRLLGFPTANINLYDELSPKIGVYAITIECKESKYKGVANIGYSPTFDDHVFTVEAHILDFNNDIYGQKIRINFIKRLRDEKRFLNISELSDQINKDISKARNILS